MNEEISRIYGKRLRVRASGLLFEAGKLLVVNHHSLTDNFFWAPPGGGVEYGEFLETTLKREVLEETGLEISVNKFAFGCEFINEPLHAIELFFWMEHQGGTLRAGLDPELQLIQDVKFLGQDELRAIPDSERHGILRLAQTMQDFQQLTGFYRI